MMKSIIRQLYWETITELEKIKKGELRLSERIAYEKAIVKLDVIKKLLETLPETN